MSQEIEEQIGNLTLYECEDEDQYKYISKKDLQLDICTNKSMLEDIKNELVGIKHRLMDLEGLTQKLIKKSTPCKPVKDK